MKILIIAAVLISIALAGTQMVEVSGFKTADQLLNDVQDDPDNIYGIVFFKRDDTNFDLTKRNKDILEALRKVADKKATSITDDKIKYLYFSRVDLSVPENKRLWERFGLNETSCDKYPSAAVMRNAKGKKIDGPAIVSLFAKNIDTAINPASSGALPDYCKGAVATVQAALNGDQSKCTACKGTFLTSGTPNKCTGFKQA